MRSKTAKSIAGVALKRVSADGRSKQSPKAAAEILPRRLTPWQPGDTGGHQSMFGDVWHATCPKRQVLEILTNKWTTLVLGSLSSGTRRFQQLRRSVDGVSQKMLTQTLRSLERDGLVSRRAYATVPPRVEYSLTPLGQTLIEPLYVLAEWARGNVHEIARARVAYDSRSQTVDDDRED
jgi:DNA-binding HxlR family transcriptional regulator